MKDELGADIMKVSRVTSKKVFLMYDYNEEKRLQELKIKFKNNEIKLELHKLKNVINFLEEVTCFKINA